MTLVELFLIILTCLCIGFIYTIFGYEIAEVFTNGPGWKPWQQALFWMFWPIIIPLFIISITAFILVSIFISILIAINIFCDLIKYAIKKII